MAHAPTRPPYVLAIAKALFLSIGFAMPLAAQAPSGTRHVVQGVVYDSVAARPLAGATVQLALRDGSGEPMSATTDAAGHFRLQAVPLGRYVLGFYHDALTNLGLDAPIRSIDVDSDSAITVALAIPSSAVVRAIRCGDATPTAAGMLVGTVRDAEGHAALSGTQLTLDWRALALDSGDYRIVKDRRSARFDSEGSFVACHLPLNAPLNALVTAPGHHAVQGPVVTVPMNGIARLDVLLADSASTSGAAMIRGRVTRESGKAVASGRVVIEALGRDVSVHDGEFLVPNLPPGTWVAEARVIGAEPQAVAVTVADSAVTSAVITVSEHAQQLDAVTVVGTPGPALRLLDEVLRRKRIGMGTTFLPGSPVLQSATWVVDVMKDARGFRYRSPTDIRGRLGCRPVAVYVDDLRIPGGFADVDVAVRPSEVLAVETWPDILLAPIQYRVSAHGCALVLIWTKKPF